MQTNTRLSLPADSPQASESDRVSEADARYEKKAIDAAIKFEGFFIAQMLHQMRRSMYEMASEGSVFKDRVGSDMLDMADTLMADKIAGLKAFGIADAILRQLLPSASENAAAPKGAETSHKDTFNNAA